MARILEVGQRVRLDHTETVVLNRWAQGKWHTYHFSDGRHFHGDLEPMITAGRLVLLESTEELVDEIMQDEEDEDDEWEDLPVGETDWEG